LSAENVFLKFLFTSYIPLQVSLSFSALFLPSLGAQAPDPLLLLVLQINVPSVLQLFRAFLSC